LTSNISNIPDSNIINNDSIETPVTVNPKNKNQYNNYNIDEADIRKAQEKIGVSVDGKWGQNSIDAAIAKGYSGTQEKLIENILADIEKDTGGGGENNVIYYHGYARTNLYNVVVAFNWKDLTKFNAAFSSVLNSPEQIVGSI
jgi:hypothetical protein